MNPNWGYFCFNHQRKWKIGKVLHFCYEGKTQKAHQCSQTSLDLTTKDKGVTVVCSCLAGVLSYHCQVFHFHDLVQSVIMHLLSQVSVLSC